MSEVPVIKAEGISKKFSRSLRTSLWYGLKDIIGQFRGDPSHGRSLREQEFWALQDISFELKRGEALGIIGNNGAGKSTLLKLLMGRLIPSSGKATCYGKIVAITHLGLGFNPILSGRENVFINAAILGMPRKRTLEVFDDIVEFAGIGDFIDSPVQTYSAGMKARLGYAVAAHLDPDILLIDEVLAVGDLSFKRKCRKHIRRYIDGGGTLILISHDMQAVQTICNRCIVLDHGRIVFDGESTEGVHYYYESQRQIEESPQQNATDSHHRVHANGTSEGAEVELDRDETEILTEEGTLQDSLDLSSDALASQHPASANHSHPPATDEEPGNEGSLSERLDRDHSCPTEAKSSEDVEQEVTEKTSKRSSTKKPRQPAVHYAASADSSLEQEARLRRERAGTLTAETPIIIERVRFECLDGSPVRTGQDVRVVLEYDSFEEIDDVVCGFTICTSDLMTHIASGLFGFEQKTRTIPRGRGAITCIIRKFPLLAGRYAVKAGMGDASSGGAIAEIGWEGSPPDYFVVESEAKVVNNMHAVIGDLVKLQVDWE